MVFLLCLLVRSIKSRRCKRGIIENFTQVGNFSPLEYNAYYLPLPRLKFPTFVKFSIIPRLQRLLLIERTKRQSKKTILEFLRLLFTGFRMVFHMIY
jgi:hypothetical protein